MSNSDHTNVWDDRVTQQFAAVLADIDDVDIMKRFLRDVMSTSEIEEISARLEAARMLKAGKKYTEIIDATKLSSRTVARISDWMKHGASGYASILDNLNDTTQQ